MFFFFGFWVVVLSWKLFKRNLIIRSTKNSTAFSEANQLAHILICIFIFYRWELNRKAECSNRHLLVFIIIHTVIRIFQQKCCTFSIYFVSVFKLFASVLSFILCFSSFYTFYKFTAHSIAFIFVEYPPSARHSASHFICSRLDCI